TQNLTVREGKYILYYLKKHADVITGRLESFKLKQTLAKLFYEAKAIRSPSYGHGPLFLFPLLMIECNAYTERFERPDPSSLRVATTFGGSHFLFFFTSSILERLSASFV